MCSKLLNLLWLVPFLAFSSYSVEEFDDPVENPNVRYADTNNNNCQGTNCPQQNPQ